MKTIASNLLKKGVKGVMKNGWRFEIYDNAKGAIRMCKVYGFETEIGSTYVHDWAYVVVNDEMMKIELSPAQIKCQAAVKAFGM
jgi:hypothetical protein